MTNIMDRSKRALYWEWEGNSVKCTLCPHQCLIREEHTGLCKARKNVKGKGLVSLNYGLFSSIAVDPIEKKPLYHWHPGSRILSLGSVGCNMACPFCQNWPLAIWEQDLKLVLKNMYQVRDLAETHGLDSVAFTYNEPLVSFEYLLDVSKILKESDINVVIVSNGMICEDPLSELAPFLNAANIDLKAFSEKSYRKLGGDLETVKRSIIQLVEQGVHVELTHLVVPGINDDPDLFRSMVRWIRSISGDLVLHLSRYFPNYLWNEAATSLELMENFKNLAQDQLNFVYMGNVPGECVTKCKKCDHEIIVREGYTVSLCNTDPGGNCPYCGADNNIEI